MLISVARDFANSLLDFAEIFPKACRNFWKVHGNARNLQVALPMNFGGCRKNPYKNPGIFRLPAPWLALRFWLP